MHKITDSSSSDSSSDVKKYSGQMLLFATCRKKSALLTTDGTNRGFDFLIPVHKVGW